MLFPLPLVPFEQYMLADDGPAYPMNGVFRLRFSGRFDRPALLSAVRAAVARHPLLSARIERTGRQGPVWVADAQSEPSVEWIDGSTGKEFPTVGHLDPQRGPVFRAWVVQDEPSETTDLVLALHHCCSDALGAFRFIEDLLRLYDGAVRGKPTSVALPPLDERLLRRRGAFGLSPGKLLRDGLKQLVGLHGAWRFFMHRPVPLVPHKPEPRGAPVPESYPTAVTRQLSTAETDALRRSARERQVTVNELLARDLFLTLEAFQANLAPGKGLTFKGTDWLRLSVPMNLRGDSDRRLPAANVVSLVFLDRRKRHCTEAARLLAGIHREMQRIKRLRLGLTFVLSLRLLKYLPGGIARTVETDHCQSTCVFTNLGPLFVDTPLAQSDGRVVSGSLVLEGMDILPPLRPHTCAALCIFTYAGRLNVTLHYDARPLSKTDAESLLETYMQNIRSTLPTTETQTGDPSRGVAAA
ncbi:MAG: condensation domain-containing protein [Thermoguttaceae bacterium]